MSETVICPQCQGRLRVSPLAQRYDIPCEACSNTGFVLNVACQCGRPARPGIISALGKPFCGRDECNKPQTARTYDYLDESGWDKYWRDKYGGCL